MRLVSLLPSATEIVYALGLGDTWSESRSSVMSRHRRGPRKPSSWAGGTRGHGACRDRRVRKERLAAGGDLYTLHAGALADLDPDLILTQDLCRVCALPSGHVEDALDHLGCRADVLSLDPHTLEDVIDTFRAVGVRAGVVERANDLVTRLRTRLDRVADAVADRPRPRVAVVEWVDPPFPAGHWVPDLIWAAGGEPVAARPGARSVETTWAEFSAAKPDVVLVSPCGFHLDGAAGRPRRGAALSGRGGVGDRRGRPGGTPRSAAGRRVEAIAGILHPARCRRRPPARSGGCEAPRFHAAILELWLAQTAMKRA